MSATATLPIHTLAGKYLTVNLAGESYGLAILKVREIIRLPKITPVPQLPAHIKGVINLRGKVVPVIDLRVKFELPTALTERACIVVVQVEIEGRGKVSLGLIVDAVEEVVNLRAEDIAPPPSFGLNSDRDYLLGMAKMGGTVKTLLDLDRALAFETKLTSLAAA